MSESAQNKEFIASCVNAGAAHLDRVLPGWYRHINLARLRMSDCRDCILGQLYGSFDRAMDTGKFAGVSRLGFDSLTILPEYAEMRPWDYPDMWQDLRDEWIRVIEYRHRLEGAIIPEEKTNAQQQ